MKTYAELVKEAIREAHEKAENEYKNEAMKFYMDMAE